MAHKKSTCTLKAYIELLYPNSTIVNVQCML